MRKPRATVRRALFGANAGRVTAWKKPLMEQLTDLCTDGHKRRSDEVTNEHELYEHIGCLKMEVECTRRA